MNRVNYAGMVLSVASASWRVMGYSPCFRRSRNRGVFVLKSIHTGEFSLARMDDVERGLNEGIVSLKVDQVPGREDYSSVRSIAQAQAWVSAENLALNIAAQHITVEMAGEPIAPQSVAALRVPPSYLRSADTMPATNSIRPASVSTVPMRDARLPGAPTTITARMQ